MKKTIAFVGVGRMGSNMARRLKEQGFAISAIYDTCHETAEVVAKEIEAQVSDSLASVTAAADLIITVVSDDEAQRAIFSPFGDSLLIGAAGKLFLNCATITPSLHTEIEGLAQRAGASSLEVCMASSITQAREGTLYLMCGGQKSVFQEALPVLEVLSTNIHYIGASGTAAQVKVLVNMVMNINTAGLAEGLGLGSALGLDLEMLMKVFSQTGANSQVLITDGKDMIQREYTCFFSATHAAKDSGIALALAEKKALFLPLARAAKLQFDYMVDNGLGNYDKSGVAELTFPGRINITKSVAPD